MANSSALPSESIAAPMPGAGKKISKMRPGTTNTARYDICDCGGFLLNHFSGVCVLKNGANKIHVELR
jgi:hypothetical protein